MANNLQTLEEVQRLQKEVAELKEKVRKRNILIRKLRMQGKPCQK